MSQKKKHKLFIFLFIIFTSISFCNCFLLSETAYPKSILHFIKGIFLIKQNKNSQAVKELELAKIQSNNNIFIISFAKAIAHGELKEFEQAEQEFTRVLELRPDFYQANLMRAVCNIQLNKYQESLKDLDIYIYKYPDSANARYLRATALIINLKTQKNNINKKIAFETAKQDLKIASENKNFSNSINNASVLLNKLTKLEKALS